MDTVTHNGTEYKKVALLAKEFNYTTDYIGQLCRAEKIDARLVGRAWYVNPKSLHEHKKNRYQDNFKERLNETEATTPQSEKHYLERVAVEPVRTNKTVKIIKHIKGEYREVPVRYEADDESLIPKVVRTETLSKVPVDLAEAEKIDISSASPVPITKLQAEPLPPVALKGQIMVSDVPEKASVPVEAVDTQSLQSITVAAKGKPKIEHKPLKNKDKNTPTGPQSTPRSQFSATTSLRPPQAKQSPAPVSFHPANVKKKAVPKPRSSRLRQPASSRALVWAVFILLTFPTVVLLLTLVASTEVRDNQTTSTFLLSSSIFSEFLNH